MVQGRLGGAAVGLLAGMLSLAPGCANKAATALVVAVSSDGPPGSLDVLEIEVERDGSAQFDRTYSMPSQAALPGTITLRPDDAADPSAPIAVTVRAKNADESSWKVVRTARLGFLSERSKLLRLRLQVACYGVVNCAEGTTCIDGACASDAVDTSTLPDFTTNSDAIASVSGESGGAAGKGGAGGGAGTGGSKGIGGGAGEAGTGGNAGVGGAGGNAGSSSVGGAGGTAGAAGSSGASGTSGKGGASGGDGMAGVGGVAGVGGMAGLGGMAGVGGSSGSAGSGGSLVAPPGMILVPVTPVAFDFAPPATSGDPWTQVTLDHSFYMDTYEVTVSRLSAWIAAGSPPPCTTGTTCPLDPSGEYPDMLWQVSWNAHVGHDFTQECSTAFSINGSTYPAPNNAMFPANCVSWAEAVAFCAWDGQKRLPTQVEWSYEARAAGSHQSFVWGETTPDCTYATFDFDQNYCGFPVNVGSAPKGKSLDGAYDLNGSVWEWGWDGTNQNEFLVTTGDVTPGSTDFDGVDLMGQLGERPLLGGEWGEDSTNMNLVSGNGHAAGVSWDATDLRSSIGMRCVKTAP